MKVESGTAAGRVRVRCAGCAEEAAWGPGLPVPFVCARAGSGDGADHLLVRSIEPGPDEALAAADTDRTFLRYGHRLTSLHLARAGGMTEAQWQALCADLDDRVAEIDGRGFVRTALVALDGLPEIPLSGRIYAKIDADNVSGSHKARHLMGVMLTLLVDERLRSGQSGADQPRAPLAIASCGNAALAAAVVARAANWPLQVYVPPDAEAPVLARLAELQASVHICERREGEAGDPCVLRFREAVALGALPFCCQGTDCGLTIEGGETLGYELIEQLAERGETLDRLVIQVGGGALASGLIAACEHAVRVGVLPQLPVIHAMQTAGGHPLERAWRRAVEAIDAATRAATTEGNGPALPGLDLGPGAAAAWIAEHLELEAVANVRAQMRGEKAAFMWPWESAPHSIAHGILDDETYDWRVLVDAMLVTGGFPVVVGDDRIAAATALANDRSPIALSHTGASGLAGLLELVELGEDLSDQTSAVILSGRQR